MPAAPHDLLQAGELGGLGLGGARGRELLVQGGRGVGGLGGGAGEELVDELRGAPRRLVVVEVAHALQHLQAVGGIQEAIRRWAGTEPSSSSAPTTSSVGMVSCIATSATVWETDAP